MKAIIRVQPKFRPYSGDLAGFRIQATIPNLEARRMVKTSKGFAATDEMVPSFGPKHLIAQSMDYADEALVTEAEMLRFKRGLVWEGFTEYEYLSKPEKPGKKLSPEAKAKIDALLERLGFAPQD